MISILKEQLVKLIEEASKKTDTFTQWPDEYFNKVAEYLIDHGVSLKLKCKDCKKEIGKDCNFSETDWFCYCAEKK